MHPLQAQFDELERAQTMPCPCCGAANVPNWQKCRSCALQREGWLTGNAIRWYRDYTFTCPKCGRDTTIRCNVGPDTGYRGPTDPFREQACSPGCSYPECDYVHP